MKASEKKDAIAAIECTTCKGAAWEPDELPEKDPQGTWHNPKCRRLATRRSAVHQ